MAQITARIVKDADNIVRLLCLEDKTDGSTVTTATVTCVITDTSDVNLPGVSWPVTLTHTSKGNYEGVVSDAMVVAVDQEVRIKVTADDGPDRARVFNKTVTVEEG